MNILKKEVLIFQNSTSDKVYEVELIEVNDQHFVNFRYGKCGGKLREGTKTKTRVAKKKAIKIFDDLIKDKIKKGYIVFSNTEEPSYLKIINLLKSFSVIPKNWKASAEILELQGSVNDIVCTLLEQVIPEKCVYYPSFEGGWEKGTVAKEYALLIEGLESKSQGTINGYDFNVKESKSPEDEATFIINLSHIEQEYCWSFHMDDDYKFFNGVSSWISKVVDEGYLYLSNDIGVYGFFLPKKVIEQLKTFGVIADIFETAAIDGFVDLVGKYISFAVFKDKDVVEDWAFELENNDAFPQYVIDKKTDIVVYGDIDDPYCANLNNQELLEFAKSNGFKMISFFQLQDMIEQFDY